MAQADDSPPHDSPAVSRAPSWNREPSRSAPADSRAPGVANGLVYLHTWPTAQAIESRRCPADPPVRGADRADDPTGDLRDGLHVIEVYGGTPPAADDSSSRD